MDVTATLPRSSSSPATPTATAPNAADADKVATQFEAMVAGQFLESMFAGVQASTLFGGGAAEKPWRSFLIQEYGKAIAESGTLGIGRMTRDAVARLYADPAEARS